jgi:hypothetical protein
MVTTLAWLRQPPGGPNAKHLLEHLDRLKAILDFDLPTGLDKAVHQNRLLKLGREGRQMTAQDLGKFESNRRYATLAALLLETHATITDEIIEMHDRIIGRLFTRAKHNHCEQFQQSGKAIHEKVRLYWRVGKALLEAKQSGADPFVAIESVIPWDVFKQSVIDAEKLAQLNSPIDRHRSAVRHRRSPKGHVATTLPWHLSHTPDELVGTPANLVPTPARLVAH